MKIAEDLDSLVQANGRIPTSDAVYTDFSPFMAQGFTCGNCVAMGDNGCDWVAVSCSSNGWCKFNMVPVTVSTSITNGLYYKSVRENRGTLDAVEFAKGVVEKDASAVHVDGTAWSAPIISNYEEGKRTTSNPTQISVAEMPFQNDDSSSDSSEVVKSSEIVGTIRKDAELRYTLGPWYVPGQLDAHGEWTDTEELQKAMWDYVKSGDRDIRLQHNVDIVAGEWLEAMTWPYPVEVPMYQADTSNIVKTTFPAGTAFLGVQWKPWAWELVKSGKVRGFSIGGTGAGIEVDLPAENTYNPFTAGGMN